MEVDEEGGTSTEWTEDSNGTENEWSGRKDRISDESLR